MLPGGTLTIAKSHIGRLGFRIRILSCSDSLEGSNEAKNQSGLVFSHGSGGDVYCRTALLAGC